MIIKHKICNEKHESQNKHKFRSFILKYSRRYFRETVIGINFSVPVTIDFKVSVKNNRTECQ